MLYPASIQKLIELLSSWPSVGPKTAERYALFLLKQPQGYLSDLSRALEGVKQGLVICQHCRRITDQSPCSICSSNQRDPHLLCVVAETKDLLAIENTGRFKGLYHVLGGVINSVRHTAPSEGGLKKLVEKISSGQITEVVLALNPDIDGETTCLYLSRLLSKFPVRLTRLARGLPTGANLEYADENTLAHAFHNRKDYQSTWESF